MDNLKDDRYYSQKILGDLTFIIHHMQGITYEDLLENALLLDSMLFRLIQISENTDRLTETFKQHHNTIPWRAMKGLRNRIVHEYGDVDLTIIYDTLIEDIPEVHRLFLSVIE